METEYSALSQSMKKVLPLQELLTVIAQGIGLDHEYLMMYKTTVWEDNGGALTLANMEPAWATPWSKYYAAWMH